MKLTDEEEKMIRERACVTRGCTNWVERGYILCTICLYGKGDKMESRFAKRKLELEKEGKLNDRR